VAIAATGAVGGPISGAVVDAADYPTLTLAGAAISFPLLMLIAAAPSVRPAPPRPAAPGRPA